MQKPTQLTFTGHERAARVARTTIIATEFARCLARRSHRLPGQYGADSPATYRYPGSLAYLMASTGLPKCAPLYARRDIWGHEVPALKGEAVAQWCLQGACLPEEGSRFQVYSMLKGDWIGSGVVYLEEGRSLACLREGAHADFVPYEHDAKGLVLVFHRDRELEI